ARHIETMTAQSGARTDSSESAKEASTAGAAPVAFPPDPDGIRRIPLLDGQKELWVASQASPEASCAFNESDILRIEGPLDAGALASAIALVLDRYEAFRIRFDPDGEFQSVDDEAGAAVERVDLSMLAPEAREVELEKLVARAAQTPFDLEKGPTCRCWLVKMGNDAHALVMYFHHLVFDGYSGALIMREIADAYDAVRHGRPVPPSVTIPYSQYVARKLERQAQA